jgi:alanine dehydrogenase
MRIGVPKEIKVHEYRVGLVPASVRELVGHGHEVRVETGAGAGIVYSTFQEMAAKNKVAYDFFSTRPAELLGKELPRWRKRLEKGT